MNSAGISSFASCTIFHANRIIQAAWQITPRASAATDRAEFAGIQAIFCENPDSGHGGRFLARPKNVTDLTLPGKIDCGGH
jgi:hypothetical protein